MDGLGMARIAAPRLYVYCSFRGLYCSQGGVYLLLVAKWFIKVERRRRRCHLQRPRLPSPTETGQRKRGPVANV